MASRLMVAAAALLISGAALAQSGGGGGEAFPMPPPEPAITISPGGRDVQAPIAPDRHTRCLQYGASIGVPADKIDDYVRRCVLR